MKILPVLFFAMASTAFAVQAQFRCSFDPPVDVIDPVGVVYAVEALRSDGAWVEVARGPGAANTVAGEASLAIFYSDNVPFGIYSIRVVVALPVRSVPSDVATEQIVPGKPQNPGIRSSRGVAPSGPNSGSTTVAPPGSTSDSTNPR